ncbi:hypothetical protein MASSI9I_20452 [Massilia sp. 9I]|nr:hypothetical protein MASSI9I_20452 [Massilia sp. 9I]
MCMQEFVIDRAKPYFSKKYVSNLSQLDGSLTGKPFHLEVRAAQTSWLYMEWRKAELPFRVPIESTERALRLQDVLPKFFEAVGLKLSRSAASAIGAPNDLGIGANTADKHLVRLDSRT